MKSILIADAAINFILGVLLIIFPYGIAKWLGIPDPSTHFYINILGAVFIGITIALLIGAAGNKNTSGGLGFLGAVSINLCGGIMLALWLVFGKLNLSVDGLIVLWLLVAILIFVSALEIIHFYSLKK